MGLFDSIGSFFSSKVKPTTDYAQYLVEQQNGCAVRVYPHTVPNDRPRQKVDLFWEIIECTYDTTTTDVAGAFEIVIRGTDAWDELIYPDDIVRIFFGDMVATEGDTGTEYNFASRIINQNILNFGGIDDVTAFGGLQIPVPGSGFDGSSGRTIYGNTLDAGTLNLYEKFVGKIDRIQKSKEAPTESSGGAVTYTITGRSIASAFQEISLYYNEFLIGLNAVNIFLGTNAELIGTPDELVTQALVYVLTSIPFPQWILPDSFINDMDYVDPETGSSISFTNLALAQEKIGAFLAQVESIKATTAFQTDYGSMTTHLNQLVSQSAAVIENSLLTILSLNGIKDTFGTSFDRSFLNSVTTGFWDLLKHLSNDQFNELWFDLCPGGDPEGGPATSGTPIPTICMRQRPFDITKTMLQSASSRYDMFTGNALQTNSLIDYFAPGELISTGPEGIAQSLFDLLDSGNGFSVYGPCSDSQIGEDIPDNLITYVDDYVSPTLINYDMGFSSHDRLNAFLCLGQFSAGSAQESQKRVLAQNGAFRIDPDSVQKFGIRIMETSTNYGQPPDDVSEETSVDYNEYLKSFSHTLSNWNFMNHAFLSGRLTTRWLRDARIGMVCKYWETAVSTDNPFPKLEISYVQGVSGRFRIGEPTTTTLTLIRGIRYDLSNEDDVLAGGPDINAATQLLPDGFDVSNIATV